MVEQQGLKARQRVGQGQHQAAQAHGARRQANPFAERQHIAAVEFVHMADGARVMQRTVHRRHHIPDMHGGELGRCLRERKHRA